MSPSPCSASSDGNAWRPTTQQINGWNRGFRATPPDRLADLGRFCAVANRSDIPLRGDATQGDLQDAATLQPFDIDIDIDTAIGTRP